MHDYVKKTEQRIVSAKTTSRLPGDDTDEPVRNLSMTLPRHWLMQGARDIRASHYVTLIYGACFVLMGIGIQQAHAASPTVALGLTAGFLIAGPFLAIGLYEVSRQLQSGEKLDLLLSFFSWCRNPKAIGRFALFLSVVMIGLLWMTSTVFDTIAGEISLLSLMLLPFWAMLAIVVFMVSVISIPMMLDRPVSTLQAIKTSVRCCLANKLVHTYWALIILLIIGTSLAMYFWPLLITGPLVGHATWHAYQSNVYG